ncbi:hypothetical protein AC1031_019428 [Aphanomyces cochlioides]|nr:hypothetical protein AC1031_019428 [Aphanomyces cochlioides]
MTSVQRELFQRLANDVPHDTKEPKDLMYDEYAIIHHKVVLYEAAKARYQIPDKPHPPGIRYMDTESMERNEECDDPFFVDDDELHATKKKVGQMENKMLGIKKIKITKTQRKKIEEETIAANKRREVEIEEQRQRGHDIQRPQVDAQRAQEIEDAWTKGVPPSNHPIPGGGWGHIADGRQDRSPRPERSPRRELSPRRDRSPRRERSPRHDRLPRRERSPRRDRSMPRRRSPPRGRSRSRSPVRRARQEQPSGGGIKFLSSQIKAPEIESFDRDHLVAWLKKRIKYEGEVRSAATEHGMAWQAYTKKWMDSISRSLLEVLCKIKLKIDQYIRNIVETRPSLKRATECEIKKALSEVLMKTKGDVNSRLLDFMDQLYTAIQDNCLQRSMEDKDVRKVFLRIAITKIRPLTLQGQVRENYDVDPRRHTLEALSDLIEEQMEIHRSAEELVEKHAMTRLKREREDSFSSSSPSPEPKTKFRRSHDRKDTEGPEASHRSRQGDLHANTRHNQRMKK